MQTLTPYQVQQLTYLHHLRHLQQLQQPQQLAKATVQPEEQTHAPISPDAAPAIPASPPLISVPVPEVAPSIPILDPGPFSAADPASFDVNSFLQNQKGVPATAIHATCNNASNASCTDSCSPYVLPPMPQWITMGVEDLEAIEDMKRASRRLSILYRQVKDVIAILCHHTDLSILQDERIKREITSMLNRFKVVSNVLHDKSKAHKVAKVDRLAFLCTSPGCTRVVFLPCPPDNRNELPIGILRYMRMTGSDLPLRCYECWES